MLLSSARLSFAWIIFSASHALASPQVSYPSSPTTTTPASGGNPCAELSNSAQNQLAQSPRATPTFSPSLARQCLEDVPVNQTAAVGYIDYIRAFVQFQSTLSYLKNPPSEYQLPAVDFLPGLRSIERGVLAGRYTSDLGLQEALWELFGQASDGHFYILPLTLYAFKFTRTGQDLVSISTDGIELPKLYLLSDVKLAVENPAVNISEIMQLDGQDTTDALITFPQYVWFQDYDASYNYKLYNPATINLATTDAADTWTVGKANRNNDTTSYSFANGTSIVRRNVMSANTNLIKFNFGSGEGFYQQYLEPQAQSSAQQSASAQGASATASSPMSGSATSTATGTASATAGPKLTGYPVPVVEHSLDLIAGYFLRDNDTSDVAVLNIPSFEPGKAASASQEFQTVLTTFLRLCRGKKRLIIDVRGNGGGSPYLAYDAFKQLFPKLGTPYSGLRFRAQRFVDVFGTEISKDGIQPTPFSAGANLQSPDGPPFDNWTSLYGPYQVNGDNFSAVHSYSFSNASLDLGLNSIVVSGYGNKTDIAPSPFEPSDVTIFTDGACTSTCGLFVNLLAGQAKVKSVVVGGRPNNAPMALIGGTQGSQALKFSEIVLTAKQAVNAAGRASGENSAEQNRTLRALGALISPPPLTLPDGGVNFNDHIAQGDMSQTPLQFQYQPADCRFFYVAADIFSVNNTWTRIARGVARTGNGLCINGTVQAWQSAASNGTGSGSGSGSSPSPGQSSGAGKNLGLTVMSATAAAATVAFQLLVGLAL